MDGPPSLHALYQAAILDHSRHPRRFGPLPEASHRAHRSNPLCGDALTVALALDPGAGAAAGGARIDDVRFEGEGCALTVAAASLMAEAVAGRTGAEAEALADRFCRFVAGEARPDDPTADLGPLAAFAAVARFPARVECARLPWLALLDALCSRAGR